MISSYSISGHMKAFMGKVDKVIINLLTILIGGAALFSVLTKFYSPEVNYSFFGENPFLVKRDIIESTMSWIFTMVAIFGLLLQAGKEIWSDKIDERKHGSNFYCKFFTLGFIVMCFVIFLLTGIGNAIARQNWLPRIVKSQKEVFKQAAFIAEHNGWREDQINMKERLDNPEKYTKANFETVEKDISQIEKLLDINKKQKYLQERIANLEDFF